MNDDYLNIEQVMKTILHRLCEYYLDLYKLIIICIKQQ